MENLVVYNIMTYINKRVPPLSEIKKEYEEMGSEKFINLYIKYEGFIGPVESIDFLNSIFEKNQTTKNNK
jgi:hypothetical protein